MSDTYTYDDGRTVTRQADGSWTDDYGQQVRSPYEGDWTVDLPGHSDGNAGAWDSNGSTVYGAEGEVAVAHARYEDADGTDYDVTVGGASAAAYAGEDELALGFGLTAASVTAEGGEWDPNRAGESRLTGGLSVGPSLGVQATYGTDADGDGRREYGAEVDALFFTIGYTTEESAPGSISGLDDAAVEYVEDQYRAAETYATETYADATQYVEQTYEDVAQEVSETYQDVAQEVSETYDDVAQEVSETYDEVSEGASEVYDDAVEWITS